MKTSIRGMLRPVAILALLGMGCGTSYSPRAPGRINFLLSARGEEVLEKDGRTYKIGGFSSDLVEAVSGNPAAEKHARTYVHHQQISHGLAIVTTVALMVGVFLLAMSTAEPAGNVLPEDHHDQRVNLQIASAVAGVIGAAALTGAAVNGDTAQSNLHDAVNIYNDDVSTK
jgi:hypothetical protein